MLGIVHRAAVKLDPAGDTLHVGEGVETVLAARQLGHAPAWALGSVGMIAHFPVHRGRQHACASCGETGEASARADRALRPPLARGRAQGAGRHARAPAATSTTS